MIIHLQMGDNGQKPGVLPDSLQSIRLHEETPVVQILSIYLCYKLLSNMDSGSLFFPDPAVSLPAVFFPYRFPSDSIPRKHGLPVFGWRFLP